jgi:quinol monooxygenase YgiN
MVGTRYQVVESRHGGGLMGQIVVVNGGTAKDYKGYLELADRAIATVEAELPGTLRYECFVDEATSRFVQHEAYADSAAILQHVQTFVESGIVEDIRQLIDYDFGVALGDVDPDARAALEQIPFGVYQRHAGVIR